MKRTGIEAEAVAALKQHRLRSAVKRGVMTYEQAVATLVDLGYSRVRVQSVLFAAGHSTQAVTKFTAKLK